MKRFPLFLLVLVLSPPAWGLTLWGIDINGLEVQSSYYSILNAVDDGAPDPLVNAVGASVPFRFLGQWLFRPEAQLFALGYKFAGGRAVPESSSWDHVVVLSLLINPTLGYEFRLGPTLSLAAEGGLGFLSRFPVFFNGVQAAGWALPVTGWLLAGRLVYPNLGTGLTWQFSPLFGITARLQAFYPIFNLWDSLPWYDELTYGGGIGVRFTF